MYHSAAAAAAAYDSEDSKSILNATQVVEEAQAVGTHCNIKASVWTGEGPNAVQANAYRTAGQLVVSTPGRIAQALENGLIQTSLLSRTLSMFVLDEADLLLLHEYEGDLQAIAPQVCLCLSGSVQAGMHCLFCMPTIVLYDCSSNHFSLPSRECLA